MDKYDKEKMKFIEDQVKILASQYDKLDIFNRQNNPYLQYKDKFHKTKEYKEIQDKKVWWQDHILQLLQDKNTYKMIVFKDRDIKENNDMILFILISLYFEIPTAYEFHHMYHKLKDLDKEYLSKRNKAMAHLKNVRQEIENNIYPYINLKSGSYKSQEDLDPILQIQLNRMYSTMDDVIYTLGFINNDEIEDHHYVNTMDYGYQHNAIWTRNLLDKTGLRQTVLRQIALLLDLIYHKQGKAFNKPSYQLLEFVMPYDDQGINMIYDLTQDEVYKIIKGISYYNEMRGYSHAFEGYHRYYLNKYQDSIEPYIKQWENNNLSNQVFNKIIEELIEIDKWIDNSDLE